MEEEAHAELALSVSAPAVQVPAVCSRVRVPVLEALRRSQERPMGPALDELLRLQEPELASVMSIR